MDEMLRTDSLYAPFPMSGERLLLLALYALERDLVSCFILKSYLQYSIFLRTVLWFKKNGHVLIMK